MPEMHDEGELETAARSRSITRRANPKGAVFRRAMVSPSSTTRFGSAGNLFVAGALALFVGGTYWKVLR